VSVPIGVRFPPVNQVAAGFTPMLASMAGSRPSLGLAADQTAALLAGLT